MAVRSKPLVSVIAVSYNHEKYLGATLESICNQTLQDFELIYCDDASKDRSVEGATEWLDRHHPDAQRIIHAENRGFCRTLNEALDLCSGKYLQIIACDDILMPEKFQRQVAMLDDADERVAVVMSDMAVIDTDGRLRHQIGRAHV